MMPGAEQTPRLPRAQLMVLYLLTYFLSVKVYRPLLRPLAAVAKLVFYWVMVHVTGIFLLWRCSLKMSSFVLLILFRKLGREVLASVIQNLWHSQAAVQGFCLYLARALQYSATRWALELLMLLKQPASPAASSVAYLSHCSIDAFLQANNETYQTALRPVIQKIVLSLFLGFLDGVQAAVSLSLLAVKSELAQLLNYTGPTWFHPACKENISDDIAYILPPTRTPLCHRFHVPATSILKETPQSIAGIRFVVATKHIVRGPGKYGLDATNIPLHVRFQSNIRMKAGSSMQGIGATVTQAKKACVVFIALYLSVLSVVIQAIR